MRQHEHSVLLVDDDRNFLRALERNLIAEPYRILSAESVEEAVDVLSRESVDVIVSDEQMPGMSGVNFLKRVKYDFPDVVRILLTGSATTSVAIEAINEAGVHRLFTKPCNIIDLAITIRSVLEEKEKLAEQELAEEAHQLGRLERALGRH